VSFIRKLECWTANNKNWKRTGAQQRWSKGRYTLMYVRAVRTARTYGPYVRVACTGRPFMSPVSVSV